MNKVKQIILNKGFLSLLITASIIAVLIFASSPVQAINITVSNDANAYQGSPYTFTFLINVEDSDLLPISHVDLQIYNASYPTTYRADYANLPLPTTASSTTTGSSSGSFGTISVSGTGGTNWGYGYGYRSGYGYGYQSQAWGYSNFGYGYGYGYNYGGYRGTTTLIYQITWTPSSSFPTGTYNIKILVYGNGSSTAFTHPSTYSFVLNAPAVWQPPTGGGEVPTAPGVTNLIGLVDSQGVFLQSVTAKSADGKVTLTIPKGTIGKTKDGKPLREIRIVPVSAPTGASTINVLGQIYDISPDGATFTPPITLTFTFDPTQVTSGTDMHVHYWDAASGEWIRCPGCVTDTVNCCVTNDQISHFTPFAILKVPAPTTPAPTTPAPTTPKPTTPAPTTPAPTTPAPTTPAPTTPKPTTPAPTTPAVTAPAPAPTPEAPTNWGLIGGSIAAAIVIIGLLGYFFWWRRRTA